MRLTVVSWLISLGLVAGTAVAADSSTAPTGQERAEAAGRGLVGSPAPRLVVKTIDGEQIDLGSLYGKKAVYLKFWATWCVPCREQMPHFEHTFETAGPDLAVIAIDVGFNESLEDIQAYRKKLGIKMPIVLDDGRLDAAFNLRVTPQHVIIGRDGRIQYVGHLANDRLDAALLAARSGAVVTPVAASSNEGAPSEGPKYNIGDRLPDVSVTTIDGHPFRFHDPRAKQPTALVFLSPWCESYLATSRPGLAANCRKVREQSESLAQGGGVRWLGIASGIWASGHELADYRQQYKVTIPLTLDESGKLFRMFRVMNVPTVLLVGADGRITRRIEGVDATLPAELKSLVTASTGPVLPPRGVHLSSR
ncbi:MAG: TlpA family protein disulfide reductase [Sinobacteraceae bacterium]|nr:TlpA family protein disulfide reductase [Nevskiaceae bacterium]